MHFEYYYCRESRKEKGQKRHENGQIDTIDPTQVRTQKRKKENKSRGSSRVTKQIAIAIMPRQVQQFAHRAIRKTSLVLESPSHHHWVALTAVRVLKDESQILKKKVMRNGISRGEE